MKDGKRSGRRSAGRVRGSCLALCFLGGVLLVGAGGCSGDGEEARERVNPADTLTRRQKDSIVSTLPVPGSGAVGKAMRAVDSLNARARQHDTMHE